MVSFSLRQRISYRFLKDPSPVSFHLIQFEMSNNMNCELRQRQLGCPIANVTP